VPEAEASDAGDGLADDSYFVRAAACPFSGPVLMLAVARVHPRGPACCESDLTIRVDRRGRLGAGLGAILFGSDRQGG
jgi:hypothetical protein